MKIFKRLVLSVFVLGISSMLSAQNAQNGLSLRVGGSFPVDFFDKGGVMSDVTLDNAATTFGDAATGWNAGLKYQLGLLGNWGLFASADVFYSDVRGDYDELLSKAGLDQNVMLPLCFNAPVMVGLNWQVINLKVLALWAEAGVGVNFHNALSLEGAFDEWDDVIERDIDTDELYRTAAAVAWQAGAGITLGGKVSLGVHYYAFGAADIEGKLFGEEGGAFGDWADKLAGEFESGKVNPSMLVLRLGYSF